MARVGRQRPRKKEGIQIYTATKGWTQNQVYVGSTRSIFEKVGIFIATLQR